MASSPRDPRDDSIRWKSFPTSGASRARARDLLYTLIWSSLFGLTFCVMGVALHGGRQSLTAFSATCHLERDRLLDPRAVPRRPLLGLTAGARRSGHG
jgi:hypothetical protein